MLREEEEEWGRWAVGAGGERELWKSSQEGVRGRGGGGREGKVVSEECLMRDSNVLKWGVEGLQNVGEWWCVRMCTRESKECKMYDL